MLVQFLVVLIYSTPSGPFFFAFYAQPAYQGEERAAKIRLFCPWFATEGTLGSYCAHAMIGSTPCIIAPTFSFVHLSACMQVLSLRSISACKRMRLSLSLCAKFSQHPRQSLTHCMVFEHEQCRGKKNIIVA